MGTVFGIVRPNQRKGWTIWGNEAPEDHERFTGRKNGRAYADWSGAADRARV
jgi:hypothetical protein